VQTWQPTDAFEFSADMRKQRVATVHHFCSMHLSMVCHWNPCIFKLRSDRNGELKLVVSRELPSEPKEGGIKVGLVPCGHTDVGPPWFLFQEEGGWVQFIGFVAAGNERDIFTNTSPQLTMPDWVALESTSYLCYIEQIDCALALLIEAIADIMEFL
jgi:hypothetical protein